MVSTQGGSVVWTVCPAAHVFLDSSVASVASAWILVFRILIKSLTFEGAEGWVTGKPAPGEGQPVFANLSG